MPNSPGGILIPKEVFGCVIERDRPRAGCPHRAIQKWQRSAPGEEGERLRITPLTIFCPPPSCQKNEKLTDFGKSAHSLCHFSLFSKTKPPPKSCQSPSNALSCERYTASLECTSAVAFAISCILSPYTMAPHAAARSGLPARRQKKRTMIFPFSLIKVIRSLSLYSPGCCVFTFVAHVKHRHRPRTVRRFFTKKSRETMARRRNAFTKISWAYFPRETLVRSFARI